MHQFSRFFLILLTILGFSVNPFFDAKAQRANRRPNQTGQATFNGPSCPNPGVENGDFTGFEGFKGKNGPSPKSGLSGFSSVQLPSADRFEIMDKDSGPDPLVSVLPRVKYGNHSIKLGNNVKGSDADRLIYPIKVDQSNKKFSFCYALVLQNPATPLHHSNQKPFFQYRVLDAGHGEIIEKEIYAKGTDPFIPVDGMLVYKDWECVCLDLSQYVGQTLYIEFTAADCNLGDHFGYAYIDGICENATELMEQPRFTMREAYCLLQPIDVYEISIPKNIDTFGLWVEEWGPDGQSAVPDTKKSKYFSAKNIQAVDIKALYKNLGGVWKCNTYYRVTLGVSTDCVPWKEMSKMIKISCPEISLSPNLCCSKECGTTLSTNPTTDGTSYHWEPAWAFLEPNVTNPQLGLLAPNMYPFTFTVSATDKYGCKASKTGTVYCGAPVLEVQKTDGCCGKTTLSAVAKNAVSYLWSTGETTPTIAVTKPGEYSVKASNSCGASTQSINVPTIKSPVTGIFPVVVYGNNFSRSGQPLIVSNYYAPTLPINATAYRITVYTDVKGSSIVGQEERYASSQGACTAFNPGEIKWNGSLNGVPLAAGTYFWRLEFKNCTYDWTVVTRHKTYWVCDDYRWLKFLGCKSGHNAEIITATNEPDMVIVL